MRHIDGMGTVGVRAKQYGFRELMGLGAAMEFPPPEWQERTWDWVDPPFSTYIVPCTHLDALLVKVGYPPAEGPDAWDGWVTAINDALERWRVMQPVPLPFVLRGQFSTTGSGSTFNSCEIEQPQDLIWNLWLKAGGLADSDLRYTLPYRPAPPAEPPSPPPPEKPPVAPTQAGMFTLRALPWVLGIGAVVGVGYLIAREARAEGKW